MLDGEQDSELINDFFKLISWFEISTCNRKGRMNLNSSYGSGQLKTSYVCGLDDSS